MIRLYIILISFFFFQSQRNLNKIEIKPESIIELEGKFAFEIHCDSCYLNFWGQNHSPYSIHGFWSLDDNLEVKFEKGFYCFFDLNSNDSIVIESNKTNMLNPEFLFKVRDHSPKQKVISIDLSDEKNSDKLVKQLNSNKVRRGNLSEHTVFRRFTKQDLNYRYRIFNIKMKVRRNHENDFERCIFSKKGISHFKIKKIPYYQILEIDSIW